MGPIAMEYRSKDVGKVMLSGFAKRAIFCTSDIYGFKSGFKSIR